MKSNAAIRNAKHHLLDLRYEKERGELVSMQESEALWGDLVAATRYLFMSLPGRLRAAMPHLANDDLNTLEQLSLEMLREAPPSGTLAGCMPSSTRRITPGDQRAVCHCSSIQSAISGKGRWRRQDRLAGRHQALDAKAR